MAVCKHCGWRIRWVGTNRTGSWRHIPSGQRGVATPCNGMVAEPKRSWDE